MALYTSAHHNSSTQNYKIPFTLHSHSTRDVTL